jgi:CubicO group peptidase (beta-lactamase class C family)
MRTLIRCLAVAIVLSASAFAQAQPATGQAQSPAARAQSPASQSTLSPELRQKIDEIAHDVLTKTGVPSASVSVVKDGRIAYVQAYGDARLEPRLPATPQMRYSIGSISKQFTAAAILLLQEQHKLSLDDKVSRWLPNLTRANEVSIRQLLSHTSGYQDFWPQDYVPPMMLKPVTPQQIMDQWAHKPLDFDPGTKWQYSNTNYVIAGVIVQKVAGMSVWQLLGQKVFTPLGMTSITDTDQHKLPPTDPAGYLRYGLGPLREAPKEGAGWMFAAGEIAMTAEDLAKWNIAVIDQKILSPASYREMEREVLLSNGVGSNYGLGVGVAMQSGHRAIAHSGEVSGFTANNVIFPDERAAVAVLTNQDAASASGQIANQIAPLLFATADAATVQKTEQARQIFTDLQQGKINRSLFTDDANAYFSDEALKDFASGLAPLGAPQDFTQTAQALRGGMTYRSFRVKFPNKTLRAWTYEMPDGKLEQYQIAAVE